MKKKILIISIITLVITLIGSTYAFFMYSKTVGAFTLTSGDINIEFVNGDNNINLTYAYPISDNFAKSNLDKLGYIDFSVNGHITEDKKVINYEIYLEGDSKNTLDSNYIKVYLTDDTNKEIISPKTYNSLDKTSYANSDNGKVIYKVSKKGEFNDKYRIYVWIDSKYSQNEIQERFSFKVNLYAYNDTETAVSVIKSKLVKYEESSKDTFTGGLVAVNTDGDLYNETDASETIREYRYSGPSVDNYVTFNDEVWRIIGVFKDEKSEEHIKIVRNEILNSSIFPQTYTINETKYNIKDTNLENTAYWNKKINGINNNDWTTGGLQYWLNAGDNKETKSSSDGYMSYLNQNAKNMITDTKYYLGTITYNSGVIDTPKETYINERAVSECEKGIGPDINTGENLTFNETPNCRVRKGYAAKWTGKIALLYLSDYGFSAISKNWNVQFKDTIITSSWLNIANNNINEWFISPSSNDSWSVVYLNSSGQVDDWSVDFSRGFRPTLYLKSSVKIINGDGTSDNAYILSF